MEYITITDKNIIAITNPQDGEIEVYEPVQKSSGMVHYYDFRCIHGNPCFPELCSHIYTAGKTPYPDPESLNWILPFNELFNTSESFASYARSKGIRPKLLNTSFVGFQSIDDIRKILEIYDETLVRCYNPCRFDHSSRLTLIASVLSDSGVNRKNIKLDITKNIKLRFIR